LFSIDLFSIPDYVTRM